MNFQYIVVFLIVAAALIYGGMQLRKKSRSFSLKKNCGDDCGCSQGSKKLTS